MTRDEAILKIRAANPDMLVDNLVALGLLKLDEPKSIREQAINDGLIKS